jgi:hypothetical protein
LEDQEEALDGKRRDGEPSKSTVTRVGLETTAGRRFVGNTAHSLDLEKVLLRDRVGGVEGGVMMPLSAD